MSLYFFNCRHLSCDEECVGHELEDHDTAHKLAIQFAGEILQDEPEALAAGHDLAVTVSDEQHLVLYRFIAMSVPSAAVARPAKRT